MSLLTYPLFSTIHQKAMTSPTTYSFSTSLAFAPFQLAISPYALVSRGPSKATVSRSAFLSRTSVRPFARGLRLPFRGSRPRSWPGTRGKIYATSARRDGFEGSGDPGGQDQDDWMLALEDLMIEALRAYYDGTPFFTDAEFNTLRDELQHLGIAQMRLPEFENLWVQATSSRDLDRRIRNEFNLSEDDLTSLKSRLRAAGGILHPSVTKPRAYPHPTTSDPPTDCSSSTASTDPSATNTASLPSRDPPAGPIRTSGAQKIDADGSVNERVKWLLFSDATEERFKIMLLYLPAVVMCFVTASVFTILFALLDGEMKITVTTAGRFRLGILSYVVVALTFWFSNQVTPVMLDYLDLGQPSLVRGPCPICSASVSCLFTGAARVRDERKCSVCGAVVGFNRRWCKVYLVSPPGAQTFQSPD